MCKIIKRFRKTEEKFALDFNKSFLCDKNIKTF